MTMLAQLEPDPDLSKDRGLPSSLIAKNAWGGLVYSAPAEDSRLIKNGSAIPASQYADQPYLVDTAEGEWLCVVTTGNGHEGSFGQHVVSLTSADRGQTWSAPVPIEPADGPEASWAVPLRSPSGRLFVFYVYNAENIRELPFGDREKESVTHRMDSHGHYVFRWSDDNGRTWSSARGIIPVREFEIDRKNSTHGSVRLFWNVGRPIVSRGEVFITLHKVAGFGAGWFVKSEGAIVCSRNLLSLEDPIKATWETLPDGCNGIGTPPGGGPVAEEQSLVELSDGSFLVVYRSIDGYPVGCYSRDRGKSWQKPAYLRYIDGRLVKHPRAACFAWRLKRGGYVLWHHNHGGSILGTHPERRERAYDDRNPAWMSFGKEVPTSRGLELMWENPEIVLYDDDPCVRMSYPDLKEDGDFIYLTETQKSLARIHRLDERLAVALREGAKGFEGKAIRREAIGEWRRDVNLDDFQIPNLPPFISRCPDGPYGTSDQRAGFSLEVEVEFGDLDRASVLAEAWHPSYGGLRLEWAPGSGLRLMLSDGRTEFSLTLPEQSLSGEAIHHFIFCVDGGPKIVWAQIDGAFYDGGDSRQFGWVRFSPHFRGLAEGIPFFFEDSEALKSLHIYPRRLLSAEAGALFRLAKGPGASSGDR